MADRELGFNRLATSSKKFSHTQGSQFDCISEASDTGWVWVKKKIVVVIKSQNQLMTLVIPARWNWEDKIFRQLVSRETIHFLIGSYFFLTFCTSSGEKNILARFLKNNFSARAVDCSLPPCQIWVFEWLKMIHLKKQHNSLCNCALVNDKRIAKYVYSKWPFHKKIIVKIKKSHESNVFTHSFSSDKWTWSITLF
jgi:hypothetical protein